MKTATRTALAASLILLLSATAVTALAESPDGARFRAIYEKEWAFRLKEFPLLASYSGVKKYDAQMGHVSATDQARRNEFWKGIRRELSQISCDRLEREECIDFRIFVKQIDNYLDQYAVRSYLIPFNSDSGFYSEWARLPQETDFSSEQDYRDYLGRLQQLPDVMDEYIALMREGLKRGITQPRVIVEGREGPILAQIVEKPGQSVFFQPFRVMPRDLPGAKQLREEAARAVMEGVVPAYRRLLGFLRNEYLPGARTTIGAGQLPGGDRFYRTQIRLYATVDMPPREIHDIGLKQVQRIRKEMDAVISEVGFDGDFPAFLKFLRTAPQFYAKTPRELLAAASYFAKKIDGRLPMVIGHLPRQPYGIAPVPDDIAPYYTAGRYVPAPLDAHRGGYYWVNTYALESRPLYAIPALTLHEAAPGHHIQGALAQEQAEKPPFRRYSYISAYGEGWALYAEKLGDEMGIYETPYEQFGRLTYEMWRACRLVIDTGVHAMGWTREQARDYLAENTALSLHEVATEVDRYISWPAQALSYKLGEYTIWQLRGEAEQSLGQRFDLRAFHDFILSLGSVPLDVLRDEVTRWIGEQVGAVGDQGS